MGRLGNDRRLIAAARGERMPLWLVALNALVIGMALGASATQAAHVLDQRARAAEAQAECERTRMGASALDCGVAR